MANDFGYYPLPSIYAGTAVEEPVGPGAFPALVPWSRSSDDVHELRKSDEFKAVRRVASADSVGSFPLRRFDLGEDDSFSMSPVDLELGDHQNLLAPRKPLEGSLKMIAKFPLISWITALHSIVAARTEATDPPEPQPADHRRRKFTKRAAIAIALMPWLQVVLHHPESVRFALQSGATWTCHSIFRTRSLSRLLVEVCATLQIAGRVREAYCRHQEMQRQAGTTKLQLAKANAFFGPQQEPGSFIASEHLIQLWSEEEEIRAATRLLQPLLQPQLEQLEALLWTYWVCSREPGPRLLQSVLSMLNSIRKCQGQLGNGQGAEQLLTRAFALMLCRSLRCHPHNDQVHLALEGSSIGSLLTQGLLAFAAPDEETECQCSVDGSPWRSSAAQSFVDLEKEVKRILNRPMSQV